MTNTREEVPDEIDMIPPYHLIDILLGINRAGDKEIDIKPVPGFVVREAGYYDRPQCFPGGSAVFMTASPDEATEAYCYAKEFSKYPGCVVVEKCWIHEQMWYDGVIVNRKYSTPR